MPIVEQKRPNGRKARVGAIAFDQSGSIRLVAGYCPDCSGKVMWSPDEMREFARKFHRQKLSRRIALRLLQRYQV